MKDISLKHENVWDKRVAQGIANIISDDNVTPDIRIMTHVSDFGYGSVNLDIRKSIIKTNCHEPLSADSMGLQKLVLDIKEIYKKFLRDVEKRLEKDFDR